MEFTELTAQWLVEEEKEEVKINCKEYPRQVCMVKSKEECYEEGMLDSVNGAGRSGTISVKR